MRRSGLLPRFVFGMLLPIALSVPVPIHADDWIDPTPDELALQKEQVEPGADAEALLWETTVDDNPPAHPQDCIYEHYLRVKIYTAAGAERFSRQAVHLPRGATISGVRARTVAPGGAVSQLARDAVFTTTAEKTSREEWKVTSFAIPNVTPGCIVECAYRIRRPHSAAHYIELPLQRDVPVVLRRIRVRPKRTSTYSLHQVTLNAATDRIERDADGYFSTSAHRLPALVVEPFMPPVAQVQASILFYYALVASEPESPGVYWQKAGRALAASFDSFVRADRAIKTQAASIVDGDPSEEQLRRLFDWCRQHIHNRTNDVLENRPSGLKTVKSNKNAAAVLKNGYGTDSDINLLFASLARAAGFEVRLAATASRDRRLFDPAIRTPVFLDTPLIAVRLGNAWQLLDPGALTIPFTGLRWQHEGSTALLCSRNASEILGTPVSTPDHNLRLRRAYLKLNEEGTLEGDVRTVLTGHRNATRRADEAGEPLWQREQDRADRTRARLAPAEVSETHVAQALPDTTLRYEESFHLRIPDYAVRVGKRLLLQPGVLERGGAPLFQASQRHHAVCFDYPWTDLDSITIELPRELTVSDVEMSKPIQIPDVGEYAARTNFDPDAHRIAYVRVVRFGKNGTICFPPSGYAALKEVFDSMHRRDQATLVLQGANAPGP